MGCDIHIFAEIKKEGKWLRNEKKIFPDWNDKKTDTPFDWRSYGMFGFFADVRNYSGTPVLAEPRGLPNDSEYLNALMDKPTSHNYGYFDNGVAETQKQDIECDPNYHSLSYLTLKELIDFNYDTTFEDLRYTKTTRTPSGCVFSNGAAIAEKGKVEIKTIKEFLGEGFFDELDRLKTLGEPDDVRIIFYFDN